jgi:hypothetical protein
MELNMFNPMAYTVWTTLTWCCITATWEAWSACAQHPPHHPHCPEETRDDLKITSSAASTSWGSACCIIWIIDCCVLYSEWSESKIWGTFLSTRCMSLARLEYHSSVDDRQLEHRTMFFDCDRRFWSILHALANVMVESLARSESSFGGSGTMIHASPEHLTVRTYPSGKIDS